MPTVCNDILGIGESFNCAVTRRVKQSKSN